MYWLEIPPPRGFETRDCCPRWGRGTYLQRIPKPPQALGDSSQLCPPVPRPRRELQIKIWI